MKKNFVKVLATTAILSMLASTTAFAGQWKSDANGWWYQNDNGSYPANTWMWIDGNGDGVSESYYFNQSGYMLANTVTPDNYTVNADGAWTVNGVVQTQGQKAAANTTQAYDAQYPLKGMVEKYFCHEESAGLTARFSGAHFPCAICASLGYVKPDGMTGNSYIFGKAVEERDISMLSPEGGYNLAVLAELSGYPEKHRTSGTPEVNALLNEVKGFMNSFDWRNASDLEKATRICNRVHKATYDWDAANEATNTGWSNSVSYGAYGCLVKGKAVCQGYTEAAILLGYAVGLKTFEMGDIGHTYPLFLVDGIWLANEPTTQNKYFTVADVYEYNPMYRMALKFGNDTSSYSETDKYQMIGAYCYNTGYVMPDKSQVSKFGTLGESFGKTSIQFKSEYR